jgi:O-antigen ligase
MNQATLPIGIAYNARKTALRKNQITFLLVAFVLFLLPIERFTFPLSLKVVDFALILLIAYGLDRFFRERQRLHVPLAFPAWLILITSLIATLTGLFSMNSIIAMMQEVYLFLWFVVLVNLLITLPPSSFENLIKIWSVVALLEATTALMGMLKVGPAMFYTSPDIGNVVLSTGEFNRGYGTFANPNATGAYLSISFFILLATSWKKWLRTILGSYLLVGILATGSMGAMLFTLIAFAVLPITAAILKNWRIGLLFGGLLSILVATIIIVMIVGPLNALPPIASAKHLTGLLALSIGRLSHSISARMEIINVTWLSYANYPFGMGPNTSVLFLKTLHNDYLAFLVERGPLGLIGWLWMVVATLLLPLRKTNPNQDPAKWRQSLTIWAGFLACALNGFTHEVSHFRQFWMPMSFLYAAYFILSELKKPSLEKELITDQIVE